MLIKMHFRLWTALFSNYLYYTQAFLAINFFYKNLPKSNQNYFIENYKHL